MIVHWLESPDVEIYQARSAARDFDLLHIDGVDITQHPRYLGYLLFGEVASDGKNY